jgi:hypothetical protein
LTQRGKAPAASGFALDGLHVEERMLSVERLIGARQALGGGFDLVF